MSHAARSLELVDGLISALTGQPATQARRNQVLKRLKDHTFARTNQFAVTARIDGLIEKFGVLCRDDLATALEARVRRLPADDKFLPDKLALLLELSYVPHLKVEADAVLNLGNDAAVIASEPTWADIVQDDPLEGDFWDDIERGYHSSGDEGKSDDGNSGRTAATSISSVQGDVEALARSHLTIANPLPPISATPLTELKLMRETLFMLRGLSTDIYVVDHRNGSVYSSTLASLHMTTRHITQDLIDNIAEVGSALNFLRGWCRQSLSAAHLRSCQAAIEALLGAFDRHIAAQECLLLPSESDVVVSMLHLVSEVDIKTHSLSILARTIRHSTEVSFLDNLYAAVCEQHAVCDQTAFDDLYRILLATLTTFLRPAVRWTCTGATDAAEHNPLVEETDENCPKSHMWHDRYAVRGHGSMPAFLNGIKQELFDLGKSQMMLALLGEEEINSVAALLTDTRPPPVGSMLPFQQHFDGMLREFISTLRPSSQSSLVDTLRNKYRIMDYFDALEAFYLLKDASSYRGFVEAIYEQGTRSHAWSSAWMLTGLARESLQGPAAATFGSISVVTASVPASASDGQVHDIRLQHVAPWYIANILRSDSSDAHVSVYSLLLRLGHAKRVLQAFTIRQRWQKQRFSGVAASSYALAWTLIVLVDTITSHVTTTGAQLSQALRKKLQEATFIDHMIEAYQDFSKQLSTLTLTTEPSSAARESLNRTLDLAETEFTALPQMHSPESLTSAWQTLVSSLNALTAALASEQRSGERFEDLLSSLRECLPRTAFSNSKT